MAGCAIMNNTPFHFLAAGLTLVLAGIAAFSADEKRKAQFRLYTQIGFALVVLTGLYIWLIVPFSLPVLVKSLGGLVLFYVILRIIQEPKKPLWWILFGAIALVGLSLALFLI